MPSRPASRGWFWVAVALTAVKLWLVAGQRLFAIGGAFHDDRLFVVLAEHLVNGQWLGPYTQFTLAKGPMYSIFIAAAFKLGVPLVIAQQLLYAGACAGLTRSLWPWLRTGAARFACYVLLLWNPMSYEAENLGRVLRQNIYVSLGLLTVAGLVLLFARRRERASRQAIAGGLAGLAFGAFWLTREESVWLLPTVGLLLLAPALALRAELATRWRTLAAGAGSFVVLAVLPVLFVSTMNLRHYGWFGTVEFRAPEFKDAYGAMSRPIAGPNLAQVPVSRQMREAAYAVSPTFARLQRHLEGSVGDHWIERELFPAAERQIRGGWMMWALRDAMREEGLAPDAATAMRNYRRIADEINAACDSGRIPARPPRSGFLPPLGPELADPIIKTGVAFTDFFFRFRDFTAYPPESIGDYADLKPFRNMVGTRLSNAPRSPELPTPEQDRRDDWKVERLEQTGQNTCAILGFVGPLLLLVGFLRGIESALDRRLSYALGLAGALLLSCCAYVAINILIHVTSFPNMTPAALAGAYPLYLLALVGIVIDVVAAARRPVTAPAVAPSTAPAPAPRLAWLAATGVAITVFGARLVEINLFASDVPYNDQWLIEAQQIIRPWLEGSLGIGDFFRPHFEHLPVWTRGLAWLQVALTGRWDPLVQMTVNAAFYATFAWLVARWTWSVLRPAPAVAITALLLLAGSLPHAWENIAWGFQSQFPLALVAAFIHMHGTCTFAPGSRRWWFAQAAGIAGLGTIATFWLAPAATMAAWLWTGPRRRADLPLALIAAVGVVLLAAIHFSVPNSFTQGTRSALEFLHSALHLYGWPCLLPGAVALIQLPWLVHALRLRGQSGTAPVDRIVFALGLFNLLQATALAFGRVGDSTDFVSRYGDLLFLGTLAGAFALVRLTPLAGPGRRLFLAVTVAWSTLVTAGIIRNSTGGHANYFHENAAANAALRRHAVQSYLATGDRAVLEAQNVRGVLFYDSALVASLLDQPNFRELLPAGVNPGTPPEVTGRIARGLQARAPVLLVLGLLLVAAGAGACTWRRLAADPLPPLACPDDPWRWRVAAIVGGGALAATLAWSNPFTLNATGRWQRWLGGDQAIKGLTFSVTTASPFGADRLVGAAPIGPEMLRNQFFGTAPEGPGFTGTVLSSPFTITTPWLIVPYAGYPVGHGNGLRIRLVDAQGNQVGEELGCGGPNREDVGYWPVDVRAHHGHRARLVLYDGRTDTEAWVAASPPIAAGSPDLALTLEHGLKSESHSSIRISVACIALVGLVCAGIARRRRA